MARSIVPNHRFSPRAQPGRPAGAEAAGVDEVPELDQHEQAETTSGVGRRCSRPGSCQWRSASTKTDMDSADVVRIAWIIAPVTMKSRLLRGGCGVENAGVRRLGRESQGCKYIHDDIYPEHLENRCWEVGPR